MTTRRRLRSIGFTLIATTACIGHATATPQGYPCVPPAFESPAECTFNFYGNVVGQDGLPMVGVLVDDGNWDTVTNVDGFYDLYQLQTGKTAFLRFYAPNRSCYRGEYVENQPHEALLKGGVKHNVVMPC